MEDDEIEQAVAVAVRAYAVLHRYRTAPTYADSVVVIQGEWVKLRRELRLLVGGRELRLVDICGWDGTDKPDIDGIRARLIMEIIW